MARFFASNELFEDLFRRIAPCVLWRLHPVRIREKEVEPVYMNGCCATYLVFTDIYTKQVVSRVVMSGLAAYVYPLIHSHPTTWQPRLLCCL